MGHPNNKNKNMKIFSLVLAVASAISSLESLQECSTCLEENDFSVSACDDRCDNQTKDILDMISDMGNDGMTYSGVMKRSGNLRTLCLQNPLDFRCTQALRRMGSSNLMW